MISWLDLAIKHPLEKIPVFLRARSSSGYRVPSSRSLFSFLVARKRSRSFSRRVALTTISRQVEPQWKFCPNPLMTVKVAAMIGVATANAIFSHSGSWTKLGGGDRGNKGYQGAENDRPGTITLIRLFIAAAGSPNNNQFCFYIDLKHILHQRPLGCSNQLITIPPCVCIPACECNELSILSHYFPKNNNSLREA